MNQSILKFGLFAAIALPVLDFGGTEPIGWALTEVLIFSLGIWLAIRPPQNSPARSPKLLLPPVLLLAWIAAQWVGSRFGAIGWDTQSIETRGLDIAAAIVVFFIAVEAARGSSSAKTPARELLVYALIGLGLLEAFLGLAQYLAGWNYIWNVRRTFYTGSATGTFINHNHFAGFLEMILPFSLALAWGHWSSVRSRGHRRARRSIAGIEALGDPGMQKCLLLLLAAVILLAAIVFSLSRMGLVSMAASAGAMFVAMSVSTSMTRFTSNSGGKRSARPVLLMLGLVAGGAGIAAWIGIAPVLDRFEQLSRGESLAAGEGRVALWKNAAQLVRLHPWAGVGAGSFQYAFTAIETVGFPLVIDHAHNDYLELTADLGIPAAAALFALAFWLNARAFQAALRSHSARESALALGSFGATAALLVHSVADFNLYIPANLLVFSTCLGIGYAAWLDSTAAYPSGVKRQPYGHPGIEIAAD